MVMQQGVSREACMTRLFLAIPILFVLTVAAQDSSTPDKPAPADAAAMVSPAPPTAAAMARAKAIFGFDCAMCHGTAGDGKGEVVGDLKLTMHDWTASQSVLDGMKDGEIFTVIKNGRGKMPPEGSRAKDEEMWALVSYVHTLGKK
jgi:mono/diheme cytochrome c family protein